MAVVGEITQAMKSSGTPYRRLCLLAGVAPSSLMRWKRRQSRGEEILKLPGPKKVEEMDIGRLYDEIAELAHCRQRTHGTTAFYEKYRECASRRVLAEMTEMVRRTVNDERSTGLQEIDWNCSGHVWALDETKWYGRLVLTVRDLGSKYRMPSLTGAMTGERIAVWLEGLFERFGAPLIMKRDNGSALKCTSVDAVLARWRVIPLDSPTYYPQYNGSVEQSQGEFKTHLEALVASDATDKELELAVDLAGHELNHTERRSLKGHLACEQFTLGRVKVKYYNKRRRMEVYRYIKGMAAEMVAGMQTTDKRAVAAAWRAAVQSWLQENGLITVKQDGKVLPYFHENRSHN